MLTRLGDADYARALNDHHAIVRASLAAHAGREETTQGDSFFAVFSSPRSAVAAAIEIQRAINAHAWPGGETLRVRMGLHTGEATESSTGLVGFEVHRAARVAAVGHGGQILATAATAGLVEGVAEVRLRDLGVHRLKDLGRPETIFQVEADGLPVDFGPLQSLDNPELANNLPASLSPFVGRVDDVTEVREAIAESRLVTLTGAGGSGKTRLALHVAAELLDGSGDGVWLVELAALAEPDRVTAAVLDALSIRRDDARGDLDSLVEALRDQRTLIILDNCEHVVDAVAKLADVVGRHCPKVRLLATSREPLGVNGEVVYRVRSLSLPDSDVVDCDEICGFDAVTLFVARARSLERDFALTDSNARVVASVCRRLDGIPLAIELAAARLATMSLDDLSERLDHRFRLLTGGSRHALPRQQTLAAMVAWSYDLLSEPERVVLRRLTVFVDGFDLRAVERVCAVGAIESFEVDDILGSLVNKSMVTVDRDAARSRYRFLETIRQFAAEQLLASGGEAEFGDARAAHAAYYLDLAEEAAPSLVGSGQAQWLPRLDAEWGNLYSALEFFAESGERDGVARMVIAIWPYFITHARREPYATLRATLDGFDPPRTELWGRARSIVATSAIDTGIDDQRALADVVDELTTVYDLALECGARELAVEALAGRAIARAFLGDPAGPVDGERAQELARAIGNPRLEGYALRARALNAGAPELFGQRFVAVGEARAFHEAALAKFREAGSLIEVCAQLTSLSHLPGENLDQIREALELSIEAAAVAEQIGSAGQIHYTSFLLGVYHAVLGDIDDADTYTHRAAQWHRRTSQPPAFLAFIAFAQAIVALARGDLDRGAVLAGAVASMAPDDAVRNQYWWTPMERSRRVETEAGLREALGDSAFDTAFARGRALTLDQLSDVASGRSPA